jgi:hypothetical protein
VWKDQYEQIANSLGCQDAFGKEIALPPCGGVQFQELVPHPGAAPRTGIDPMLSEELRGYELPHRHGKDLGGDQ